MNTHTPTRHTLLPLRSRLVLSLTIRLRLRLLTTALTITVQASFIEVVAAAAAVPGPMLDVVTVEAGTGVAMRHHLRPSTRVRSISVL